MYTYAKGFGADKRIYEGNLVQLKYPDGRVQPILLPTLFRDEDFKAYEIKKPENVIAIGGGKEPSNDY